MNEPETKKRARTRSAAGAAALRPAAASDNIQVLERALLLLEVLARQDGEPVALGKLAELTGLKTPTAARIMATLLRMGYVVQEGRRKGYALGEMAYALGSNGTNAGPLLSAAKAAMADFARDTGEYVCLSVLRGERRVIVHQVLGTHAVQINLSDIALAESPWRTNSGKMLLAHLPDEELERRLSAHFGPTDAAQIPSQRRRLQALRNEKLHIEEHHNETSSVVAPVRQHGVVIAVLGAFMPTYRFVAAHRQAILDAMRRTATCVETHPGISGTAPGRD
ncbi:MAG: IclR family transcriptional regulator [Lentisphaerae bacterium]|nr:IclR family transcriptional regulator [Lentisphaerota bacterium]